MAARQQAAQGVRSATLEKLQIAANVYDQWQQAQQTVPAVSAFALTNASALPTLSTTSLPVTSYTASSLGSGA